MRFRSVRAALVIGLPAVGSSPAESAQAASGGGKTKVLERPISFQVQNVNESKFACPSVLTRSWSRC